MVTKGIQNNLIYNLYKNGCYFLALCSVIEDIERIPLDVITWAQTCIDRGLLTADMYVKDASAIIRTHTHKGCIVTKQEQRPSEADYIIEHWVNQETKTEHFRRPNMDTWSDSNTVAYGMLKDYRALYIA